MGQAIGQPAAAVTWLEDRAPSSGAARAASRRSRGAARRGGEGGAGGPRTIERRGQSAPPRGEEGAAPRATSAGRARGERERGSRRRHGNGDDEGAGGAGRDAHRAHRRPLPHPRAGPGRRAGAPAGVAGHGGAAGGAAGGRRHPGDDQGGEDRGAGGAHRRAARHRQDRHRHGHGAGAGARHALHGHRGQRDLLAGDEPHRGADPGLPPLHRRPHQGGDGDHRGRSGGDPDRPAGHRHRRQGGQADAEDDGDGDDLRPGHQDDRVADAREGPGGGRHHHRQGDGQDHQAGPLLHPRPRLRRHGLPDQVRAVPGRGAAEAQGGGAHRVAARGRRHQQPHPGLPRPLLGRHGRDQDGGAGADQRQGGRVARGGQGRGHPGGAVHRRGAHAGHRVLLLPQPGAGERHGARPHHGHQPRHHPDSGHQLPEPPRAAHRPARPAAHHLHGALQRQGDQADPQDPVRGGGRGDDGRRLRGADAHRPGDVAALRHPAHHRRQPRRPQAQGRGGAGRGHQARLLALPGRVALDPVHEGVSGGVPLQRAQGREHGDAVTPPAAIKRFATSRCPDAGSFIGGGGAGRRGPSGGGAGEHPGRRGPSAGAGGGGLSPG